MISVTDAIVTAPGPRGPETWSFAGAEEARTKAAFVEEALSWRGTPFRDCADVKGPAGAVDCAMLLTRCAVDSGLLPPFDPRPYAPRHMMHRSEEHFLDWIRTRLGGREVDTPRFGDVAVWRFGRVFSHGGVLINDEEIVHAYAKARKVIVSRRDEPFLKYMPWRGGQIPRPVKFFDVWSSGAAVSPQTARSR